MDGRVREVRDEKNTRYSSSLSIEDKNKSLDRCTKSTAKLLFDIRNTERKSLEKKKIVKKLALWLSLF